MDFKGIKQRMLRKKVSPAETPWQRAMEEMEKNKVQKSKEKEEAEARRKICRAAPAAERTTGLLERQAVGP